MIRFDCAAVLPCHGRMNTLLTLSAAALLAGTTFVMAAESKDPRTYELRIYHAAPGKLDDLNKRFRDHTLKLFEKHGMENIGYWTPIDNTNNLLIYLSRFRAGPHATRPSKTLARTRSGRRRRRRPRRTAGS
jgi:hypothetical protein